MTNPPQILAAIEAITAGLGPIAKDGKGPSTQGGYAFVPVASIVRALNPLLAEHHVVMRETVLEETLDLDSAIKATPTGDPIYDGRIPTSRVRAKLKMRWTWISTLDGSEFPVENIGEAHDVADKAARKANTAAYKEMLLRTFAIEEGDGDPDASDPTADAEQVADRRNRGQQKVDKARPTAGRTSARATPAPKMPAPEPTPEVNPSAAVAAPTPAVAPTPAPAVQPTPAPAAAPQPQPEPEAAYTPDPEDVAYAEEQAPEPERTPSTSQPVAATTQTERRGETVATLKNDLRRAWVARGMNRDDVNALGKKLLGKEPSVFLFNINDLKTLMKAVEAGEMA